MSAEIESLKEIIEGLEKAERLGTQKDEPEGSRYIQISDTLASKMISDLRELMNGLVELEKATDEFITISQGLVPYPLNAKTEGMA